MSAWWNIIEGSLTEEVTWSGKSSFEGGFKLEAFEGRNKFDCTDPADRGSIGD